MNNRFITTLALTASSLMFVAGCSEDSPFETPPGAEDLPPNEGVISQKNLAIGAEEPTPGVYDPADGSFTAKSTKITVKIGDLNNQKITGAHTIYFATEWGLIGPSCTTVDGECSVTWETSAFNNIPGDLLNTITAWTLGEEAFIDTNDNGKFDDNDSTFEDREEPFVDANLDGIFNTGDILIDVVNGNDTTGANGAHDIGDGFLNSPNCTHSSLCSTVLTSSYIWVHMQLDMEVPVSTTTP